MFRFIILVSLLYSSFTFSQNLIELPGIESIIYSNNERLNPLDKEYKIYTIIDGNCGTCVSDLKDWKDFMKELDLEKVGFIYLVKSEDNLSTFKYLIKEAIDFSYPYFPYTEQLSPEFVEKRISNNNTFLLNRENQVILKGNPIKNNEIKLAYKQFVGKKSNAGMNFKLVEDSNGTDIKISGKIIYKNQNGDVLTEEEAKKMISSGLYIPNVDTQKGEIVLTKRD